ncbi:MAG: phytanoyl-CoA dioxygenase family protein, partial [bacterium]|nr:phytanoyl-CoA dioxygenase family protein [bacterium]
HVQFPMFKGDAVFFNPSLFHAAGTNTTRTVRRMANLLQVSSAFGRPMESVDREALVLAVYDDLVKADVDRDTRAIANVIAATAEGYAFPTNLDREPPLDGLPSPTQATLVRQSLAERWTSAQLAERLSELRIRRGP